MESPYERALTEIGHNGKFQKRFDVLYIFVLGVLWIMAYNNIILALTIIPHTCKLPDKPENISNDLWKIKHIPTTEDKGAKIKFDECLIHTVPGNNNNTVGCNEHVYDTTWYETTISSDNNWICAEEINVANVFASSKIGEVVGSVFFGWFADVYGRKPTYTISLALLLIGRFLSVFASSSYYLFALGCIVASFPSWSAIQSTTVISLEISSHKRRSRVAKIHLSATSFGMFLMPFIFWWLRSWKTFMIVTTATQLPYLLMSWKILESPQWLWINRKTETCIQQLKIISKRNKTKLEPDTESEILNAPTILLSSKTKVLGPLALFSGKRLTINTLLQLFLWIAVSISYTAILISSGEKSDGNPFLEFALQSLAEIPGYIVAAWLADRIGRRYTGVTSCILTALIWLMDSFHATIVIIMVTSCLAYFFFFLKYYDAKWILKLEKIYAHTSAWINSGLLSTILMITNRFLVTISYYIINLFNMELYPTCLRQSGMSLGNVISSAASALAPYILFVGRRFGAFYPGAILAMISLLGGLVSFILPETLNAKLPETIDDAKNFGCGT